MEPTISQIAPRLGVAPPRPARRNLATSIWPLGHRALRALSTTVCDYPATVRAFRGRLRLIPAARRSRCRSPRAAAAQPLAQLAHGAPSGRHGHVTKPARGAGYTLRAIEPIGACPRKDFEGRFARRRLGMTALRPFRVVASNDRSPHFATFCPHLDQCRLGRGAYFALAMAMTALQPTSVLPEATLVGALSALRDGSLGLQ